MAHCSSQTLESKVDTFLELQALPMNGLQAILDFMYSGKLRLCLDNVTDALHVAAFFQATPALRAIGKFLKSRLTFSNMDKLVSLGVGYGLHEMKEYRARMVMNNFLEFTQTFEFLSLDADTLSSYLAQDSLRTTTEAQLLKAVLKWYDQDRKSREKDMHRVLDKVRYTIDGWPTIEYASKQEIFKKSPKCHDLLVWSKKYMQNGNRQHLMQNYRTRVRYDQQTLVQMGGIQLALQDQDLDFVLPSFEYETEPRGTGLSHYYHKDLQEWLPLGCIARGDCRSHCPLVSVNNHGILVGGYLYTSDMVSTIQVCSNEVKLLVPSGSFALWDMPYMKEPRAHHTAVHARGNDIACT